MCVGARRTAPVRLLGAGLAIVCLASQTGAEDLHRRVAGWTLTDEGHRTGNDTDRNVTLNHTVGEPALMYRPAAHSDSGIVAVFFAYPGCTNSGTNSGTIVDLSEAPDRDAAVRVTVHSLFRTFAATCKTIPQDAEATLMAGFTEAFGALETRLRDHPFEFPPEAGGG